MMFHDNKKHLFLADFTNSFSLSKYMAEANKFAKETKSLTIKGTLLCFSVPKKVLLSGIISLMGVNYKAFDDKAAALKFLTE